MRNLSGFLLLFDSGIWSPVQFTHWAYFYDYMEPRQPGSTSLAPWVSFGYAQTYPEMKEELEKRGLLPDVGPEGFSPYFPGGAVNNNGDFWKRHASANVRWRLPPCTLSKQLFPCENAACLLCVFTREQEALAGAEKTLGQSLWHPFDKLRAGLMAVTCDWQAKPCTATTSAGVEMPSLPSSAQADRQSTMHEEVCLFSGLRLC